MPRPVLGAHRFLPCSVIASCDFPHIASRILPVSVSADARAPNPSTMENAAVVAIGAADRFVRPPRRHVRIEGRVM